MSEKPRYMDGNDQLFVIKIKVVGTLTNNSRIILFDLISQSGYEILKFDLFKMKKEKLGNNLLFHCDRNEKYSPEVPNDVEFTDEKDPNNFLLRFYLKGGGSNFTQQEHRDFEFIIGLREEIKDILICKTTDFLKIK
jgi:hypothetical protein